MNKYLHLKEKALSLRIQNKTLNEICELLSLPKTTVYYWIKGTKIPRTDKQNKQVASLSKYNRSNKKFYEKLRGSAYLEGVKEFTFLKTDFSFLNFVTIFACEGYRKGKHNVCVTNSDLAIMILSHNWMNKLSTKKATYALQLYEDNNVSNVVEYWATHLKIDKKLIKVWLKKDSGKLKGRNTRSLYGTLTIRKNDTYFRVRVQAWMDILKKDWLARSSNGGIAASQAEGMGSIPIRATKEV